MVRLPPLTRRSCLAAIATALLPGLARSSAPVLQRRRTLPGAYLTRPAAAAGSGMFARWGPPLALALRGGEMLVADPHAARLWRVDTTRQTMRAVSGAPVGPGVLLALGPGSAAWVLDPQARQVLCFGRDGRLLRTLRLPAELVSPVAMVLANGGTTLLLGDGLGAQWIELPTDHKGWRLVEPRRDDGSRAGSVDGLAVCGDGLCVLDRHAGVVLGVSRDGRIADTFGHGELLQPLALAVDPWQRLIVHDAGDACLKLLQSGSVVARLDAVALGLGSLGAMAHHDGVLALADAQDGAVTMYQLDVAAR
jgi:hypothetical protein